MESPLGRAVHWDHEPPSNVAQTAQSAVSQVANLRAVSLGAEFGL